LGIYKSGSKALEQILKARTTKVPVLNFETLSQDAGGAVVRSGRWMFLLEADIDPDFIDPPEFNSA